MKNVRVSGYNITWKSNVRKKGFNETIMWDKLFPHHLSLALKAEYDDAIPVLHADLKDQSDGDAAFFADRCIDLQLQVPGLHLKKSRSRRVYKMFQPNLRIGLKNVNRAQAWRNRVLNSLLWYHKLHRANQWFAEYDEANTDPVVFAIMQAEEIVKLSSVAFWVPKSSEIAKDFQERLTVIREAVGVMQAYMTQKGVSAYESRKFFLNAHKLEEVWNKWQGRNLFVFYVSDLSVETFPQAVEARLSAQIPFGTMQTSILRKLPAETAERNVEKKAIASSWNRPIMEYNDEVFRCRGSKKGDALAASRLKEDMAAFADALYEFQQAAMKFQEMYPVEERKLTRQGNFQRKNISGR
jgi:hypothetical protein